MGRKGWRHVEDGYAPSWAMARNACGVTMAIPRNGCSNRRSASPLIRWLARPLTANSRNLLSLGSRHSVTLSVTSTVSASRTSAAKNSNRFASSRYLLNFGRRKTSSSSATVAADTRSRPRATAASNACRGTERGSKTALTATLVSTTVRSSLAMQQRLQDFGSQAASLGLRADLVHDLLERPCGASSQLPQAEAKEKLQLASLLGGRLGEGACGIRINFDRDSCYSHDNPHQGTARHSRKLLDRGAHGWPFSVWSASRRVAAAVNARSGDQTG